MARHKTEYEEQLPEVEGEQEGPIEEPKGKKVTVEEVLVDLDRRTIAIEAALFRLRSI